MKPEPTHVATKLSALIPKLTARRSELKAQIAATQAELSSLAEPVPFDEHAATIELARASTRDALEGTETHAAIRKRHERERASTAKACAECATRVGELRKTLAAATAEDESLALQLEEARAMLADEIAASARAAVPDLAREHHALVVALVESCLTIRAVQALMRENDKRSTGPGQLSFTIPTMGADVEDLKRRGLQFTGSEFGGYIGVDRGTGYEMVQRRCLELRDQFAGMPA